MDRNVYRKQKERGHLVQAEGELCSRCKDEEAREDRYVQGRQGAWRGWNREGWMAGSEVHWARQESGPHVMLS